VAIVPSKYQLEIYDAVEKTSGHMIINAVAGSGKTTTLLEIMKRVDGRVIFLAFNKSIADELSKKVPQHVDCSTLHSAGLKMIKAQLGNVKVDPQKIDGILKDLDQYKIHNDMSSDLRSEIYELRKSVKQIVSIVKNSLVDYTDVEAIQDICDYFSIEFDCKNIDYIKQVMELSVADQTKVDFDDMIFLPVLFKMKPRIPYDFVMVDESQDLNKCQIELVLKLVDKQKGRIIAVGDPKQSIYGFRGADAEAMNRIKTILDATEYPLSVCYRCPTSHIDLIKHIVPQIEPRPDAIKGIVENISERDFVETIITEKNPLILSRTNAYAVTYAMKLIAKGYRAIVRGRDLGSNLVSIVRKLKAEDMEDFYNSLLTWKQRELVKLDKRKTTPPQAVYDAVEDKYATLLVIADNCDSVFELTDKITNLFSDDGKGVSYVFSTIHKAKGLETDVLYILGPKKIPLMWKNQKPHETEQEMNLKYVCYSRSTSKLVIVHEQQRN